MPGRILAIGDIHGCLKALDAVLAAVALAPDDTLITLGDYVDRGDEVRGVVERLIQLRSQCLLVPVLGNHDEMLLDVASGKVWLLGPWLEYGGETTLASYGCQMPSEIQPEHLDFLRHCHSWAESERHFFVHANYLPKKRLDRQPGTALRWESLRQREPGPHRSGKTAIVGHTSQKSGEVLDLGYLKCIDTWVYGDGYLTALDVETGQTWQADKAGNLRR